MIAAPRCAKPSTVGSPLSAMWEAWNQRAPPPGRLSFVSAPQPILSNIEIADNILEGNQKIRIHDGNNMGISIHDNSASGSWTTSW